MGKAKLPFSGCSRVLKRRQNYALIISIIGNSVKDLKLLIFNREIRIPMGWYEGSSLAVMQKEN